MGFYGDIPSGNDCYITIERSTIMGKSHIFRLGHFPVRYVKLPEGNEVPYFSAKLSCLFMFFA